MIKTPMLDNYREIRSKLPEESFLFLKLGDFWELFEEDAKRFKELYPDHTIMDRNGTPMLGIPYHAIFKVVDSLRESGYKVGLIDEVEHTKGPKPISPRRALVEFR